MSAATRRWTVESGAGRIDVDGIEWFACDPYPYWYRWTEDDVLVTPFGGEPEWADSSEREARP